MAFGGVDVHRNLGQTSIQQRNLLRKLERLLSVEDMQSWNVFETTR